MLAPRELPQTANTRRCRDLPCPPWIPPCPVCTSWRASTASRWRWWGTTDRAGAGSPGPSSTAGSGRPPPGCSRRGSGPGRPWCSGSGPASGWWSSSSPPASPEPCPSCCRTSWRRRTCPGCSGSSTSGWSWPTVQSAWTCWPAQTWTTRCSSPATTCRGTGWSRSVRRDCPTTRTCSRSKTPAVTPRRRGRSWAWPGPRGPRGWSAPRPAVRRPTRVPATSSCSSVVRRTASPPWCARPTWLPAARWPGSRLRTTWPRPSRWSRPRTCGGTTLSPSGWATSWSLPRSAGRCGTTSRATSSTRPARRSPVSGSPAAPGGSPRTSRRCAPGGETGCGRWCWTRVWTAP